MDGVSSGILSVVTHWFMNGLPREFMYAIAVYQSFSFFQRTSGCAV